MANNNSRIASDPTIQRLSAIMLANMTQSPDGRRMSPRRGTAAYNAYQDAQNALWDYTGKNWQQLGLPGNRWTINPATGELYEHESAKKTALKIGVTTGGMLAGGYGLGTALGGPAAGGLTGAEAATAAAYGGGTGASTVLPATTALGTVAPTAGKGLADIFTNPKNLLSLAPIIGALATRGGGGGGLGSGGSSDAFLQKAYEDAQANNALKETRFRRVDPLHQAITQLAFNRLPDSATQGLAIDPMALPTRRT